MIHKKLSCFVVKDIYCDQKNAYAQVKAYGTHDYNMQNT